MKRIFPLALAIIMCLSICSCEKHNDDVSYYLDTELEQLETFTSVTGIELNTSQDAPESDSVVYNYIMDNNANGIGAIVKYDSYLQEYGFEKVEALSNDDTSIYFMGGYVIATGQFSIQANVIQYVITIPNKEIVEEDEAETDTLEPEESAEPEKDIVAIYEEFCQLVDAEDYTQAVEYADTEALPLDYADTANYFAYASAMKLYKETELLTYEDIAEVVRLLTEDVSDEFKDASDVITKINGELDSLIGTHMHKRSSKYLYDAYYLVILDNGEIILDLGSSRDGNPQSTHTDYQLVYVNLENGSYYMICRDWLPNVDHCSYAISIQSNYLALSRAWGDEHTDGMYAGNYTTLS